MSEKTAISWADSTFNPWMGCTKVSPACDHCYAERDTRRFGRVQWGAGQPRVRTTAAWKWPARWNQRRFMQCGICGWRGECEAELIGCGACGSSALMHDARRRVFCASLADWMDNEVPIEWLVDLLDLIRRTPNLDWLLLTKRIGNWHNRLRAASTHTHFRNRKDLYDWIDDWLDHGVPPANVWIGSTVINQQEADRDVPKLLCVPARVRFLSIEPMLEPISLTELVQREAVGEHHYSALECDVDPGDDGEWAGACVNWVIAGGESGPHARPMHPDWVRGLRDQCVAAGVPFHFKQWGEWAPNYLTDGGRRIEASMWMDRMGKKTAGRLLDGIEHNAFPAVSS